MIESQIRELFSVIARGEPEISLVDAELARRRGRARLRWRWAAAAGTPLLAAATVVAVVVTVGLAPAHPRLGTAVTGNGPAAPRQFSPLVPYLSFGWLPAGQSLVMGGVRRTVVSIEGGSKPYSAHGWDLNVYAAGQCHFTPAAKTLKCGAALPEVPGTNIVGPAPAVRGHSAWWAGSSRTWWASAGLVWQYARNGWAWLFLPNMYRYSPQQMEAVKRDAVKIAGHVRYGTPTLPLVFPAQLTHLPHNWRVSSVVYLRDGRVLRARSYALAASSPSLGADGGLDYQSGLPYFTIDPASRKNPCYRPGQSTEMINGFRVVVTHSTAGTTPRQDLCAAHADGLTLFVSELGSHPAIGVASLFRSHLRLLGGNPANWVRNPFG